MKSVPSLGRGSVLIIALTAVMFVGPQAHGRSLRNSPLTPLKSLAGQYGVQKVLLNPEVHRELTQMAGAQARKFPKFMAVETPMNMVDGDLVASGGYPHEVPEKCAVVVISFGENRVYAGLFENGNLTVYAHGKRPGSIPTGLANWIASTKDGYIEGPVHVRYR